MNTRIDHDVDHDLGSTKRATAARLVYYALIVALGLMLMLVVFLAR